MTETILTRHGDAWISLLTCVWPFLSVDRCQYFHRDISSSKAPNLITRKQWEVSEPIRAEPKVIHVVINSFHHSPKEQATGLQERRRTPFDHNLDGNCARDLSRAPGGICQSGMSEGYFDLRRPSDHTFSPSSERTVQEYHHHGLVTAEIRVAAAAMQGGICQIDGRLLT